MESRCGTGRRRDCLRCYKDRGSLWGAWRENVGTTLKFVWMPLSTIWCNVQFGMWHFKWKLCFPDESDLGRVELEGVLYFEPYLTAWINNPLFRCWADVHPLLMLSFDNHASVLSPLWSTVSCTEIRVSGSEHSGPLYRWSCLHDWGSCSLNIAVNTCQPQLHKSLFNSCPGSSSHFLKCFPYLNL